MISLEEGREKEKMFRLLRGIVKMKFSDFMKS
jgi:hypothetical protein